MSFVKQHLFFSITLLVLFGCTKEVEIDIPGYEEQLVIDGRIETGLPPFVLLSTSKEVYSPTDLNAFINSFVSGATVTVSDGTTTVQLDELCTDNLPAGTEDIVAGLLGISVEDLSDFPICGYTTLDPSMIGEIGETYTLTVTHNNESYSAQTSLLPPVALDSVYWKPDDGYTDRGYSWVTLADPPNDYNAYTWEVKRLNTDQNGDPIDPSFEHTSNPVFDDEFFDGLTFDFFYENPFAVGPDVPENWRFYYAQGDTVAIKLSRVDQHVFEYLDKKFIQIATAGNPFATPTNIPTNLSNGALGIWAGYSPFYDTLICEQ